MMGVLLVYIFDPSVSTFNPPQSNDDNNGQQRTKDLLCPFCLIKIYSLFTFYKGYYTILSYLFRKSYFR